MYKHAQANKSIQKYEKNKTKHDLQLAGSLNTKQMILLQQCSKLVIASQEEACCLCFT